MLIFLDQIINSPSQTDVIYFDISKAFNTVSHSILLNKLWSIGITGTLWSWFKEYLSNRYQKVIINNSFSDSLPVVSGVPQGSILGPLFLVYINDMSSYINHSQFLKFANDTKCFLHINTLSDHINTLSDHITLQEDITAVFTWSQDFNMDFNVKKFIHLSFKSKLNTIYTISDTCIPRSDSHKNLGITLSVDLSWNKHYKTITARAYKVLGLICRTFSSCHSTTTMTRLYVSLVRSQLFYCTQIWRPHLMKDILNIE